MSTEERHTPLRCFCSRKPLLATYGIKNGELFVHVKVFKQQRIFGEVIVTGGVVRIHCRECLRWHRVIIKQPNRAALEEEMEPDLSDNQE